MFIDQNNLCYICQKKGGDTKGTRLVVDHDHEVNRVRKLLCNGCNRNVGSVEHDVEKFMKTLDYMREHDSSALARLELLLREGS